MKTAGDHGFEARDIPVVIHAASLDPKAREQIQAIARHPAILGPIAIMPDAHAGAGCVIGFTGRFREAVIPNIVGVDIGCGVASVPLVGVEAIDFQALDDYIRERIPLGMNQRRSDAFLAEIPLPGGSLHGACSLCDVIEEGFFGREVQGRHLSPLLQLGSLGGGNHFIEVGRSDRDGGLHLIVHSGSRNLGKRIAEHYQDRAAAATRKLGLAIPKGLEFLPLEAGGEDYLRWARLAQAYARFNRRFMLASILAFFELELDEDRITESVHNYISEKDHIIRKGAISAHEGERVIVPLNMADGTLLGVGKGIGTYNWSAPHGAGRSHGRREMFRMLEQGRHTLAEFRASMEGIFSTSLGRDTFDESKFAYKDPAEIEPFLRETIHLTDRIRPVYNLKAAGE